MRDLDKSRKEGVVIEYKGDGFVKIMQDNGEPYVCWADRNVKLLNMPKFIIIAEIDGKLAPVATPKTYVSREQAEKVALEMASKTGSKMFIFEATNAAEPPQDVAKLVSI